MHQRCGISRARQSRWFRTELAIRFRDRCRFGRRIMNRQKYFLLTAAGLLALVTSTSKLTAHDSWVLESSDANAVRALFDLDHPDTGPFPSDVFTVVDPRHNTGRRV